MTDLRDALEPIDSLIRKTDKARQKLAPGTWQHTRMREYATALEIAAALLRSNFGDAVAERFTGDALAEARIALTSMIQATERSQEKIAPGTAQHTLQRNRLAALRLADERIEREMNR